MQLGAVVAQGLAQVVVAEDHPLADDVLHIEMIRHGAHHVGPETLAFEQRELDQLAAGDVADAQDDRVMVLLFFRQAQHQPQVLVAAMGVLEFDFQFQLLVSIEQRFEQLRANGVVVLRTLADQQLPGLVAGIDVEQFQRHLVDFGDVDFLAQLLELMGSFRPGAQLIARVQAGPLKKALSPDRSSTHRATPVPSKISW